jgi:transcriptional regulator with XRE-family HTH domain
MAIGFKIKELREKKNLTQEELAADLETSQSYISKIENGTLEKIDFLFMHKVCEYFGVDFNYFMEAAVQNNVHENNKGVVVGNCGNIKIVNEKKGNKNKSNDEN